MTTILLNAVFNPLLEIVHRSGQQLLIGCEHFLPDGILQLVQITVCECTHGPAGTPRGINQMTTIQEILAQAMEDFIKRRIENCIQQDGRHLNDIVFHT